MEVSQKQVYNLIKQFSGQANVLTIPRIFIDFTGDHISALVLSQVIYWSERTNDPEGWFYKTQKEWEDELGISKFQLARATETLIEKAGLEHKIRRVNKVPINHYRLDPGKFSSLIFHFLENQETGKSRNSQNMESEETRKSDFPLSRKSSYTETTCTETTTKTTTTEAAAVKGLNNLISNNGKSFVSSATADVINTYVRDYGPEIILAALEQMKGVVVEQPLRYIERIAQHYQDHGINCNCKGKGKAGLRVVGQAQPPANIIPPELQEKFNRKMERANKIGG